jgi:putative hydrolase of the HAD superfamily
MVLVFDLDDTLFPEREFVYSGLKAVDRHLSTSGLTSGFYPEAASLFDNGVRKNLFDGALQGLGLTVSKQLIDELVGIYRNHTPSLSLYDDASWLLDQCKGKMPLGIITDGFLQTQVNKISALQLNGRVDCIIYSDAFGRSNWKPSATPYLVLMDRLRCSGGECVYVADNPSKDFVTARRLGWRTIQIVRDEGLYSSVSVPPEFQANQQLFSLRDVLSANIECG